MIYHLLAFITISIWGTTFVSTKMLLTYGLTPAAIFFMRFAMAYIGMAAAQCIQNRRTHHLTTHGSANGSRWFCRSWQDELKMVVAGLAGGSVYFLTENTALQKAMAGNVSLIVCLAPLITALFARLFHLESKPVPNSGLVRSLPLSEWPSWPTAAWGMARLQHRCWAMCWR